jgi:hypothetical protein
MEKLKHLPIILMLGIYLIPSLFGLHVFQDVYATIFFFLLALFVIIYYALYSKCASIVQHKKLTNFCWRMGKRINWKWTAWFAIGAYAVTLIVAVSTVPKTPLGAALSGGDWLDIATARGNLFANRQGVEVVLRYLALILGRCILPFILTYLFWANHRLRYWALIGLLLCYLISLEKASPIFAFASLTLLAVVNRRFWLALSHVAVLIGCIAIWTFFSTGGIQSQQQLNSKMQLPAMQSLEPTQAKTGFSIGRRGDPNRHYFFNYLNNMGISSDFSTDGKDMKGKLMIMVNRSAWIPYITAYDWLKFQDDVLNGAITNGQQISFVSWMTGRPKLPLEQMVYEYEFGVPPNGAGASNTVFFVDAKLAWGWVGVVFYCFAFAFFSAIIFSSKNDVAKVASVNSFFTAALSPLTATLLSGGLFFYIVICLLVRTDTQESMLEK